jgi:hypothetical protein
MLLTVGAVGVVAVMASLTVGANLDRLLRDRSMQGWTWDVMVGFQPDARLAAEAVHELRDDPRIAGLAVYGDVGTVTVDGRYQIPAVAHGPVRGHVTPYLLAGTAPPPTTRSCSGTTPRAGSASGSVTTSRSAGPAPRAGTASSARPCCGRP